MRVSQEAGEAGRFVVAYLVLLSTAINFALHSMLSTIMNLIILAVRFVENCLRSLNRVAPSLLFLKEGFFNRCRLGRKIQNLTKGTNKLLSSPPYSRIFMLLNIVFSFFSPFFLYPFISASLKISSAFGTKAAIAP